MKKIILFLLSVLPIFCHAQFVLTPNGFKSQDDGKDFIVKPFPGKSATYLYDAVANAILVYGLANNSDRNSPNASNIEGEIINIFGTGSIQVRKLKVFDYKVKYNMVIRFRDGRVRFDAPIIHEAYTYNGYGMKCVLGLSGSDISTGGSTIHVFRKDGDLKEKRIKESLDNLFNDIIERICNSIEGDSDDDW